MKKQEVKIVSERLKENIKLVKSMGFEKLTLSDYYTSVMKILEDITDDDN